MSADSIFQYSPHERRHGPGGYLEYKSFKPWLRDEFSFRCAYCLFRETWFPDEHETFGVDHFVPQSHDPTLACEYENLFYACSHCNSWRRDQTIPEPAEFARHIRFLADGNVEPLTVEGFKLIKTLDLDGPTRTTKRKQMLAQVRVHEQQWPASRELLAGLLGFPVQLPDLASMRPPSGNSRPTGIDGCYFEQRRLGTLPEYLNYEPPSSAGSTSDLDQLTRRSG